MKITLGVEDILYNTLSKLGSLTLPFTIQTCIKLNLNRLLSDMQTFTESKNELLKKYGTEKDGVVSINPNAETWDDFYKEYVPLVSQEVDFNAVKCIYTHEELLEHLMTCEGIDQVNISAQEIDVLALICKQNEESN